MDSIYSDLIPRQIFFWKNRKPIKINQIGAGHYCSFAIDINGQLWGWGLNNYAQLGLGRSDRLIYTPTVLKLLKTYEVSKIKGGEHHTLAVTKDGSVLSWGRCDDSQIGKPLNDIPKEHVIFNKQGRPTVVLVPTKIPSKFLKLIRGCHF
jgi:regulator of chromosome condensation